MTAKELVEKYKIYLVGDENIATRQMPKVKKDGAYDAVMAAKKEIIVLLKAEKEAIKKATAEREAKIEALEGLSELERAIAEHREYQKDFERMMDDECNDGLCAPKRPISDIAELKEKYPRAAAYLKAEDYSLAANAKKSSAGHKALERIIDGGDYKSIIADMENEWADYCNAHMWD